MSNYRYQLRNCSQDRDLTAERFDVAFSAAVAPLIGVEDLWEITYEPGGTVVASGVGPAPALFGSGSATPTKILVVEDNPADVELIQMALATSEGPNDVYVVHDGERAIDFLRQRGEHQQDPRPDIVLLDLNLPGLDGHEVLREIKSDPELHMISVIVITNSDAVRDINKALEIAADAYLTKPFNTGQLLALTTAESDDRFTLIRRPGSRWS